MRGQGLVDYTLVLVLVLIVVIAVTLLIGGCQEVDTPEPTETVEIPIEETEETYDSGSLERLIDRESGVVCFYIAGINSIDCLPLEFTRLE